VTLPDELGGGLAHVLLRKAYSLAAFALVGVLADRALPRARRPALRAALVVALFSALIEVGSGFHPVGVPSADDLTALAKGLAEVGRSLDELELVGGVRATFPDDDSCADLAQAMDTIAPQLSDGYTTFCIKPSQFIDDGAEIGRFCRAVIRRAEAL